jgi:hypothetical protein
MRRRLAAAGLLLCISAIGALIVGEVILRLVPIPGISYHSFYYDSMTGGKYVPNSILMYRSQRGERAQRRANDWGFPDHRHDLRPAPGTLRIGFFGDSYAEALQVPLENTFFRVIEDELNRRACELNHPLNRRGEAVQRFETLSFGISGRGTLQSYLECRQWMAASDLDYVVYVFVENDPGDQIPSVRPTDIAPYPVLSADTFVVDRSFHDRYGYKDKWPHRALQYIKANSLVVSTIEGRLKLLMAYGIKRSVTEAERTGAVGAAGRPGMAPSSWHSDSLVTAAWELEERVLGRWARDVQEEGRRFLVYRVPREEVLLEPLEGQDSWAPRLHEFCARSGIPLIDPTPYLAERARAGHEVYYDHFTSEGHRAFAESFVSFLLAAECGRHREAMEDNR